MGPQQMRKRVPVGAGAWIALEHDPDTALARPVREGAEVRAQNVVGSLDRDLLAMLASQAALSLANLRTNAGLARAVVDRTAEARGAQAAAEHRAARSAVASDWNRTR